MEETISLKEIFDVLKKRMSLIVAITVLATGIGGVVSYFFIQPVYKASTQILVSQAAAGSIASIAGMSFDADAKYIETYNVIMKSPYILDQVIDELNLNTTPEKLNGSVSVTQQGQSQIVTVGVENHDPADAVLIANEIATVFQKEISQLMRIDNIHILSPAELSENPAPIKPQPTLNMAIAFVVGLMASVGIAFLMEFMDNTIKNEQDIEKALELPVLGTITTITDEAEERVGKSRVRGETA